MGAACSRIPRPFPFQENSPVAAMNGAVAHDKSKSPASHSPIAPHSRSRSNRDRRPLSGLLWSRWRPRVGDEFSRPCSRSLLQWSTTRERPRTLRAREPFPSQSPSDLDKGALSTARGGARTRIYPPQCRFPVDDLVSLVPVRGMQWFELLGMVCCEGCLQSYWAKGLSVVVRACFRAGLPPLAIWQIADRMPLLPLVAMHRHFETPSATRWGRN